MKDIKLRKIDICLWIARMMTTEEYLNANRIEVVIPVLGSKRLNIKIFDESNYGLPGFDKFDILDDFNDYNGSKVDNDEIREYLNTYRKECYVVRNGTRTTKFMVYWKVKGERRTENDRKRICV